MRESVLSGSARALLHAARNDGPGVAARAKMWGTVSATTGIVAAVEGGGAAGATALAATSTGKLLVAGALLGSALTLGLALAVVRVAGGSTLGPRLEGASARSSARAEVRARAGGPYSETVIATGTGSGQTDLERLREEPPPIPLSFNTLDPLHDGPLFAERCAPADTMKSTAEAGQSPGPRANGARIASDVRSRGSDRPSPEDLLSRESAFILEARGALRRGNPEGALASLEAARRVGSNKMEPEELVVRARVLRALGRDLEASEADEILKARYPDQVLVR